MPRYEYKVVPAPRKAVKIKGARSSEDRFAMAIQTVLNTEGANGWEYMRAEALPAEEREGLMSKTTVFQNLLIFRRELTLDVITPETQHAAPRLIADKTVPAASRPVPQVKPQDTQDVPASNSPEEAAEAPAQDTEADPKA